VGAGVQWGWPAVRRWRNRKNVKQIHKAISPKLWRELYMVIGMCDKGSADLRMSLDYVTDHNEVHITIENVVLKRWWEARLFIDHEQVMARISLGTDAGESSSIIYPHMDKDFYARVARQTRNLWLQPDWKQTRGTHE
jgi:hypothetical protein